MAYLRLGYIRAASGKNPGIGLYRCIDYIFNEMKTEDQKWIGGHNLIIDKDQPTGSAYHEMLKIKYEFGKVDGRQGYHYKLSFPKDDAITPELAMKITEEFLEEVFPDYQCAYAVHTNTAHLHSHIVVNSIDMVEGYKYRYQKGDWAKYIQPKLNEICRKYFLSELDLSLDEKLRLTHKCMNYRTWMRVNDRPSSTGYYTNAMIKEDIDFCIKEASNWDEFIRKMEELGHTVIDQGKHFRVLAPGRKRYCRTYILSEDHMYYEREMLKRRISGEITSQKDIWEGLMKEWEIYLLVPQNIRLDKYLSKTELVEKETEAYQREHHLETMEDVEKQQQRLDDMDHCLNILRKRLHQTMDSKENVFRDLRIVLTKIYLYDSNIDDEVRKEVREAAKRIMEKGYSLTRLYDLMIKTEQCEVGIGQYKKHIFVEKKNCERLMKKMKQEKKAQR